eukprot:gnl/MRDRNA2_/MRDRNA2_119350_c0_seq1.p1 gnl/MRDRNA2_/MRDRNA2_119350_c0~~gnl/MRDRNA2_/MRDRNA2_119350_c0_seq1.p1  ORF type:complete len:420 (+),score=68.04 gnl/MRDRNA2_/MRDRNA2_119350_c0_seq1:104-1363(+)
MAISHILLALFYLQTHAKEDPRPHEMSVDQHQDLVGRFLDKLIDRALTMQPLHTEDMDDITLGKSARTYLSGNPQIQSLAASRLRGMHAFRSQGLQAPWAFSASPKTSQQARFSRINQDVSTGAWPIRDVQVQASSVEPAQTFATVKDYSVFRASDGAEISVSSLLAKDRPTVFGFLTHFGDFNCWELAQRLIFGTPEFTKAGADIRMVGVGSVESARKFASMLDIDPATLYTDPTGSIYKALGYSKGFMPESDLNGYVKLFPMLLGISSPGTLQAVFSGYIGNSAKRRDWVTSSLQQGNSKGRFPSFLEEKLWDIVGKDGLRPFELATLRLQNMVGVLGTWEELAPKDDQLVVLQGGSMIVRPDGSTAYAFADRGILTYTDVDELLAQVKALSVTTSTSSMGSVTPSNVSMADIAPSI